MAEYHYKYNSNSGSAPTPAPNDNRGLIPWAVIVGCFLIGLWPVGVFLLILQIIKSGDASARRRKSYNYTYRPGQAAQTRSAPPPQPARKSASYTASAARSAPPPRSKRSSRPGQGLIISGSILTGVFGFAFIMALLDALSWGGIRSELSGLAALASFTAAGAALLYTGLSKRRKSRHYKKYQALIGKRTDVNITTLAKATGRGYQKVCADLQEMLDEGVLPTGYLDLSNDRLILSDQGIADAPEAAAEEPAPAPEPREDDAILAEIREINDAILDPTMSAKIDRIQVITGKILDYQRRYPDKAGQLRSFLNYYLPTTLKILRAYAQLEHQGIEGENITTAKQRIEGMMDKVVEGFEKQLDKLFENAAMDISSDVAVLEKMLENDGLSSPGGMTLGT